MTEQDKMYLRRSADELFADQVRRNMENLEELRREVQKLSRSLSELERSVEDLARKSAQEAVRETLKMFGLSPDDQAGIERTRATMRFGELIHGMVQRGLMVGVGIAVTLILSAIAIKLGWKVD
jgi:predicted nuclease with TOPRIM domain